MQSSPHYPTDRRPPYPPVADPLSLPSTRVVLALTTALVATTLTLWHAPPPSSICDPVLRFGAPRTVASWHGRPLDEALDAERTWCVRPTHAPIACDPASAVVVGQSHEGKTEPLRASTPLRFTANCVAP